MAEKFLEEKEKFEAEASERRRRHASKKRKVIDYVPQLKEVKSQIDPNHASKFSGFDFEGQSASLPQNSPFSHRDQVNQNFEFQPDPPSFQRGNTLSS